jgi:KaiC/GvpD/RAD55 family RecA-like ATPase
MVNTVLGPMETSEMGRTLMHEHAVCFDMALKKAFGKKWVDEDAAIELIVKELKAAKEYSGIQNYRYVPTHIQHHLPHTSPEPNKLALNVGTM